MDPTDKLNQTGNPPTDQADMDWSQAEFLTKRTTLEISRDEFATILISSWQRRFGLFDWEIRYDATPIDPEDGLQAEVLFRFPEKVAVVRLDAQLPLEGVEGAIVHELLHLVFKPLVLPAQKLAASVGKNLSAFTFDEIERGEEQVIEQIVRSFGFRRFRAYGDLLNKGWKVYE